MTKLLKLTIAVTIPQLIGMFAAIFISTSSSIWYDSLIKPYFTPQKWVFCPIWIFLYFLMGISLYIVWQKTDPQHQLKVLGLFAVQLVLNILWPILFFVLRSPVLALLDILLLLATIVFLELLFNGISKAATYLMVPYMYWVGFSVLLNFYIVEHNPAFSFGNSLINIIH